MRNNSLRESAEKLTDAMIHLIGTTSSHRKYDYHTSSLYQDTGFSDRAFNAYQGDMINATLCLQIKTVAAYFYRQLQIYIIESLKNGVKFDEEELYRNILEAHQTMRTENRVGERFGYRRERLETLKQASNYIMTEEGSKGFRELYDLLHYHSLDYRKCHTAGFADEEQAIFERITRILSFWYAPERNPATERYLAARPDERHKYSIDAYLIWEKDNGISKVVMPSSALLYDRYDKDIYADIIQRQKEYAGSFPQK